MVEAFGYRDAISDMNEFESYSYWFDDFKREKDKPEGSGIDHSADHTKPKIKKTERNRNVVDHAMESADNYLMFFKSRGYDQNRAVKKPQY